MNIGHYNLSSLAITIVLLYFGLNFLFNKIVNAGFKTFQMPSIFGIIVGILALINTYMWDMKIINPFLINVPIIEGTYDGYVDIRHIDSLEKEIVPVEVTIRQSGSETCFDLYTEKGSHSHSIFADVIKENGIWYLYQIYSNENKRIPDNPNKYEGTCKFEIKFGKKSTVLEGRFYTDENRKTFGTVNLKKVH